MASFLLSLLVCFVVCLMGIIEIKQPLRFLLHVCMLILMYVALKPIWEVLYLGHV